MKHTSYSSRRLFLKQLAAVGVSVPVFTDRSLSAPPGHRIRHASFGAAGMAGGDANNLSAVTDVEFLCATEVNL